MKKLVLTTMIAALLVTPLQSVALADHEAAAPVPAQVQEDFIPGTVPAALAPDAMTPALHAMVLATLANGETWFDFADQDLCWEALYNMLSLYGQMDDRVGYDDQEHLVLPSEIAGDYASAFFPQGLGEAPESVSDRLTYHEEEDSYHLVCGSDALAQLRLTGCEAQRDRLVLSGDLVYLVDGESLVQFQAVLVEQDNLFGYRIMELEIK